MPSIIIELGINHLGDPGRAERFLSAALATQADAITFQIREPAFYAATEPGRTRLPVEFYREAAVRARAAGKQFGLALCDPAMVSALAGVAVDFWKTLSWDLYNEALQAALRETGKPLYVSTGVSSLAEIKPVIAANPHAQPIQTQLSRDLAHVNLAAIRMLREETGRPAAFGLHCGDLDVALLALAFAPSAIFFYVKEAGSPHYFDNEHAVPLPELDGFVNRLKRFSTAIGDGRKHAAAKPSWIAQ